MQKNEDLIKKVEGEEGNKIGQTNTVLICMNVSHYKYYVYNLKGILRNRFNFSEFVAKYGQPKAVSNNGKAYIFKSIKNRIFTIFNLTLKKGLELVK